MSETISFFQKSENQDVIQACRRKLEVTDFEDERKNNRRDFLIKMLKSFSSTPKDYDELCTFNIEHIGIDYINELSALIQSESIEDFDKAYVSAYRFLSELSFTLPNKIELNFDFRKLVTFVTDDIQFLEGDIKTQIIYANYTMPVNIAKKLIQHENIGSIKEFNSKSQEADKLRDDWNNEIKKKQQEVEELKNKLGEYKTGFNFVGLYDGFNEITDSKKTEKNIFVTSLIVMALLILTPLISEIVFVLYNYENIEDYKSTIYLLIFPTLAIELLFIYFFRILLHNYKSVKAQILQLELRKTLCQFIQSYADYSKDIKEKDNSALEKFENLIFSGLVTNDEKLPSTYDGLSQLSKFIKDIKK